MTRQAMKTAMGRMAGAGATAQALGRFWNDESGQDLLEFALVAALLALCAVATMKGLAGDVATLWGGVQRDLSNVIG